MPCDINRYIRKLPILQVVAVLCHELSSGKIPGDYCNNKNSNADENTVLHISIIYAFRLLFMQYLSQKLLAINK